MQKTKIARTKTYFYPSSLQQLPRTWGKYIPPSTSWWCDILLSPSPNLLFPSSPHDDDGVAMMVCEMQIQVLNYFSLSEHKRLRGPTWDEIWKSAFPPFFSFWEDCLLTSQEQDCSRITSLFVLECSVTIISTSNTLFQARPDQEWGKIGQIQSFA